MLMVMGPPSRLDKWWFKKTKQSVPMSINKTSWSEQLMRLVPYRFRGLHHAYATAMGFFWLPCVLCDFSYGGHEGGGTVPDPMGGPHRSKMICSQCGCQGRGVNS